MRSIPIIMQPESVKGILKQWEYQNAPVKAFITKKRLGGETLHVYDNNGCKTETRRLTGLGEINESPDRWVLLSVGDHFLLSGLKGWKKGLWANFVKRGVYDIMSDSEGREKYRSPHMEHIKCPYGVPGDELWVREAFAYTQFAFAGTGAERGLEDSIIYKADDTDNEWDGKWVSPMFMPKAASRITLINEGVPVERLQSITDEGALREGCEPVFQKNEDGISEKVQSARDVYDEKWCSMHGEESWNLNPWVWVVKFSVKEVKNESA